MRCRTMNRLCGSAGRVVIVLDLLDHCVMIDDRTFASILPIGPRRHSGAARITPLAVLVKTRMLQ